MILKKTNKTNEQTKQNNNNKERKKGCQIKKCELFFISPKKPFGKLLSKTIFKRSSETPFLRKIGKFKIGLNLVEGPMEIMQIRAYSKRSYEKTEANL